MELSNSKLESLHNKFYDGKPELTDGSGLSVRISPHGVITFQYRYRWQGKPVKLALGRYPSTDQNDARIIVKQMHDLYAKGLDTKGYFSKSVIKTTLQDCLGYWLEMYVSTLNPNTQTLYKSVLYNTMYTEFKSKSVTNISVASWRSFFEKQEKENPKKA